MWNKYTRGPACWDWVLLSIQHCVYTHAAMCTVCRSCVDRSDQCIGGLCERVQTPEPASLPSSRISDGKLNESARYYSIVDCPRFFVVEMEREWICTSSSMCHHRRSE